MMRFSEYQESNDRFYDKPDTPAGQMMQLLLVSTGLAGEVGEVTEPIKKMVATGKEVDLDALAYELGDVLSYIAAIASTFGISMEAVAAANRTKLQGRYHGKVAKLTPPEELPQVDKTSTFTRCH